MSEQREASEDAVMTRIGQTAMLLHAGDREEARVRLGALWAEIGSRGDALQRCALAHYMADAQEDPADELAWDLRALDAAEGAAGAGGGLLATLHLDVASAYLRLHRGAAARTHLARATAACRTLPDDAAGADLRLAITRLAERAAATGAGPDLR